MEKVARALMANGQAEDREEALGIVEEIQERLCDLDDFDEADDIMADYGLEPDYLLYLM